MGTPERPERYRAVAACAIAGAGWLCWLALGLQGWPDRLYLASLTAVVGTIAWMAFLWRRDRDVRASLPAIVAAAGLLAMIGLSLPQGPEHVALMAVAGLAATVAAWLVRLLPRLMPASARSRHLARSR